MIIMTWRGWRNQEALTENELLEESPGLVLDPEL